LNQLDKNQLKRPVSGLLVLELFRKIMDTSLKTGFDAACKPVLHEKTRCGF
jgi:hypothetical protein